MRARSESVKEKCSLSPGARRELGTYCKTSEYNNNDSAHAWTSVFFVVQSMCLQLLGIWR